MKILAVLIPLLGLTGLTGCATSEDHGIELASTSTDCSDRGRQKPIGHDNGAGQTWQRTNTSRWCDPRGGMNPQGDPTFEGSN